VADDLTRKMTEFDVAFFSADVLHEAIVIFLLVYAKCEYHREEANNEEIHQPAVMDGFGVRVFTLLLVSCVGVLIILVLGCSFSFSSPDSNSLKNSRTRFSLEIGT
jgi:hypothetical protein